MNIKLYSILPYRNSYRLPLVYGYCNKGLPGIEIVGLGPHGKTLKEKIVFITREMKFKFPAKKYVLVVEGHEDLKKEERVHLKNLDLSFLILFWKLAGLIKIARIESCLCAGSMNVKREFTFPEVNNEYWHFLESYLSNKNQNLSVIGPQINGEFNHLYQFPIEQLMNRTF